MNFFGGCPSGTTVSLDTALLHWYSEPYVCWRSFHPHAAGNQRRALELIEAGVIRAKDFVDGGNVR